MHRRMQSGPMRAPLGCYEHAMKNCSFLPFSRATQVDVKKRFVHRYARVQNYGLHAVQEKKKGYVFHNISTFIKCKAIAPNIYKMQCYCAPAPPLLLSLTFRLWVWNHEYDVETRRHCVCDGRDVHIHDLPRSTLIPLQHCDAQRMSRTRNYDHYRHK